MAPGFVSWDHLTVGLSGLLCAALHSQPVLGSLRTAAARNPGVCSKVIRRSYLDLDRFD
jgi:F0F1-type ATP synthase membrane subunit c/vacuolar-type H+-ATPase subunit K